MGRIMYNSYPFCRCGWTSNTTYRSYREQLNPVLQIDMPMILFDA